MRWTNEYILVFVEMHPGISNAKIEQRLGIKLSEELKSMIYDLIFKRMSVLEIIAKFEKKRKLAKTSVLSFIQKKKIQNPSSGLIDFELYDYQKNLLNTFENHDEIYIRKGRQMGMTTLSVAYALYLIQTISNYSIFFHSYTSNACKHPRDILSRMIDIPTSINNKRLVALSNGSYIIFGSNINDLISHSFNMMIFDEVAFTKNMSRDWLTYISYLKVRTNSKLIIQSTPNSQNNWFYNTWKTKQNQPYGSGRSRIATRKITWVDCPYRDNSWRKSQDRLLGKKFAKQECDAEFI